MSADRSPLLATDFAWCRAFLNRDSGNPKRPRLRNSDAQRVFRGSPRPGDGLPATSTFSYGLRRRSAASTEFACGVNAWMALARCEAARACDLSLGLRRFETSGCLASKPSPQRRTAPEIGPGPPFPRGLRPPVGPFGRILLLGAPLAALRVGLRHSGLRESVAGPSRVTVETPHLPAQPAARRRRDRGRPRAGLGFAVTHIHR